MGFTEAIKHVFSNYANFNGRARRSEYWYFAVFTAIIGTVLNILTAALNGSSGDGSTLGMIVGLIAMVVGIALFIPSLAVSIRRLHDIGKSGWFILLNIIPVIGTFIVLYFCIKDSETGENMYGPNPKGM